MFVIPKPNKTEMLETSFELTRDTNAYVSERYRRFADDALFLLRKIFTSFSGKTIINDNNLVIKGGINFIVNEHLQEESYKIKVDQNSITLCAGSASGFLYAVTTLKQILVLPPTKQSFMSIDGFYIEDSPKYDFRGFVLDEARHFMGKTEVKRIIELMALNKMNKLIWHLSDDQGYRLESKLYPELTRIGSVRHDTQIGGWNSKKYRGAEHKGYYTATEIAEIVEFAAERNVEIIPELDLPCHSRAMIAALPQLGGTKEHMPVATTFGNNRTTVCLTCEDSFDIITNVIDEWCKMFPSRYFHLGGDFDNGGTYDLCDKCTQFKKDNNLENLGEFFSLYFNKLSKYISEKHARITIIRDSSYSEQLDENIIVQIYSSANIHKICSEHSNRKLILSPANSVYFDYPYAITPLNVTYNNCLMPAEFANNSSNSVKIIGGASALWSEWVYDREKSDFNCYPRIPAVSERYWSDSTPNYRDFINRFYGSTKLYDDERVNYAKQRLVIPNAYRRFRDSWLWLHSDQYSEVRRNR